MQEAQVVELVTPDTVPTVHKLGIFLLSNLAAFGATWLVERGYVGSLAAWHQHKANLAAKN